MIPDCSKIFWIGIGCTTGVSRTLIETAIETILQRYHLALESITGIATIDRKAKEQGILEFCRDRNLPLKTFTTEQLNRVNVPTPSSLVDRETGTPSVAEAAAILAASGCLIDQSLLVSKQIFKLKNEPGSVTIAIAQSNRGK